MTKMSAAKFAEVKKFISDFIDENGYSPSLMENVLGTGMPQTKGKKALICTVYLY